MARNEDKERVAWKIWDGEGFDDYFVNWTDCQLRHIREVVTEKEHTRLLNAHKAYLAARERLVTALKETGLGPEDYE